MLRSASRSILTQATPAALFPKRRSSRRPGFLLTLFQSVLQSRKHSDGCPMLVVMKYRDFQFSLSRLSISKHLGAEMSSRLIPREVGHHRLGDGNDFINIRDVQAQGKGVDSCEFLEKHCFAFHNGHAPRGPISPSPNTAVPSVMIASVLPFMVYW